MNFLHALQIASRIFSRFLSALFRHLVPISSLNTFAYVWRREDILEDGKTWAARTLVKDAEHSWLSLREFIEIKHCFHWEQDLLTCTATNKRQKFWRDDPEDILSLSVFSECLLHDTVPSLKSSVLLGQNSNIATALCCCWAKCHMHKTHCVFMAFDLRLHLSSSNNWTQHSVTNQGERGVALFSTGWWTRVYCQSSIEFCTVSTCSLLYFRHIHAQAI